MSSIKQANGRTEAKHTATVKSSDVYRSNNGWLIGSLIIMTIIAFGSLAGLAMSDNPEPMTPVVETVKPMPTLNDTQNSNDNDADHGSVNINGDKNTVSIDNRVTEVHHHHETERVVERVTVIEKPVIHTVTEYRTASVVKKPVDNVSPECEDSMAEHHERVAGFYRTIAASKRGTR